jgi:hypothetical protein
MAVFAQADGTVQGSVMDESRGALPGATLTLTELTTGRQYAAVTDARGEYRLVNVAAGAYKLQADHTAEQIAAGNTPQTPVVLAHDLSTPYAIQSAIGFQKQLGAAMGVEADLPISKVDLRVTKIIRLRGNAKVSGIAELFNVFNHDNFGSYNGQVNSATFGQPVQNPSNTFRSRTGQLAFRVQF